MILLTQVVSTRTGHSAKKPRAGDPETRAGATQHFQLHNSIRAGSRAADASLHLPETCAQPGSQRAPQTCRAPAMAANPTDTQVDDDIEWSDDDDPAKLLALIMDTQPEVDGPTYSGRGSAHGVSDEADALVRSIDEEVHTTLPLSAIALLSKAV